MDRHRASARMSEGKAHVVAVVEDDDGMRTAIDRLLSLAGFTSTMYPSAEAFLAAPARKFDCMVVDIQLPGISGLELQQQLAAAAIRPQFIFITAHDSPDAERRAYAAGASAYLRKPFLGRVLIDAINRSFTGGRIP